MQLIKKLLVVIILFLSFHSVFAQSPAYQLSTHILDISKGLPVKDVNIVLYKLEPVGQEWVCIASGKTDGNGRIANFLPSAQDNTGTYKLKFDTEPYFQVQNLKSIYPYVEIVFKVEGSGHYHIPITMSANGYATYRGN